MRLLAPDELLRSDIVANSTMNRQRVLHGVNSYTRELGFDPILWLIQRAEKRGGAAWLDVCCGEGRALLHAAQALPSATHPIRLIGADLIGPFAAHSFANLELIAGDIAEFVPPCPLDLITCVHGLHYLGDKLGFLENAYRWLNDAGVFIGHLDPANIRAEALQSGDKVWPGALRRARRAGVDMELRNYRLRIARTDAPLEFGTAFAGCSPSEQPNYTGITVIDSWYT